MATAPIGLPLWPDLHAACVNWPRASLPADERDAVVSDRPVLLLAGARDPTGATGWADAEHRRLVNSVEVVMPYYGHGDSDACTVALTDAFIARPEPAALDTTCATRVAPWLFRY
jgi:hypothetical protein